jgi:hypothetical protein
MRLSKRWFALVVMSPCLIFSLGICTYLYTWAQTIPWGMMGGDCPEASSYGGFSVSARVVDVQGNPVAGVPFRIRKAEGVCPQSEEFEYISVTDGEGAFSSAGPLYLGDPPVEIAIAPEGYERCTVLYDESWSAQIELVFTLNDHVEVEGGATISETSQSLDGVWHESQRLGHMVGLGDCSS